MSFTEEVKHELIRKDYKQYKTQLAQLAALIRMNGSIQITNKKISFKIKIYYGDLARRVYSFLKDKFSFSLEIIVRRHNHFSQHHVYEIVVPSQPGINDFFEKLGLLGNDKQLIFSLNESFLETRKMQKAYLRGIFLGGGSINSPESEYHLEFRTEYENHAEDILKLLDNFSITGHMIEHKGKYVIYIKKYEDIIKILNLIGAHKSLLKMENSHIVREYKNNVNRQVNYETANLDKTVKAAMNQLSNIHLIEDNLGLDNISDSLREIAELRKKHPYASLKELGKMLDPTLSKSGVYHRIRRLKNIAEKIRGED